jgi:DNA-directed RNA polymerase subunit RPC12/RpoP
MITSPTVTKIAAALLLAQKEIGGAKKGATNPFFKMKYSDLGSVMEACKDAFNNHGISVIQPIVIEDGVNVVKTTLLHESGEFISSSMKVSCKNPDNPQEMGSAITYAKRYALQALAFIPSEDDDGEKATQPYRPQTNTNTTPPTKVYTCMTCKKEIDKARATVSWTKIQKFMCTECETKLAIKS